MESGRRRGQKRGFGGKVTKQVHPFRMMCIYDFICYIEIDELYTELYIYIYICQVIQSDLLIPQLEVT